MVGSRALEHSNIWVRMCQVVLYPATRLLGRRRYVNAERLHRSGPMIVVGNHISHLDPVYDVVLIHKAGRIPHVMAKAGLWKIPVVRRFLAGTEQIPVHRGGAGQAAVEQAQQWLADGGTVLIYPEGTVTKEPDFWPMRPRLGIAALALAGDYPVVPIVHWGTQAVYNSYAKGRKLSLLPRKDVTVLVGPDIDLSAYRDRPADQRTALEVSLLIMNTIAAMLGEIRGQTPPPLYDAKKAEKLADRARAAADATVADGGTAAGGDGGGRPADGSTAASGNHNGGTAAAAKDSRAEAVANDGGRVAGGEVDDRSAAEGGSDAGQGSR